MPKKTKSRTRKKVIKSSSSSSSSSTSSSSSSNSNKHSEIKYLPPEVWTQILLSLPAKTLLKFRCVCKSWCSIVNNPDFVNMHFKLCKSNSGNNNKKLLIALQSSGYLRDQGCLLTVRNADNLRYTGRIFRTSDSYMYDIVSSCNGLLLVQRTTHLIDSHKELRLWNPCIRKSLILPTCPLDNSPAYWLKFRYLLGFAPDSQDYKVVAFAFKRALGGENGMMIYFAVYTLSNQQWIVRNDPLNVNNVSILNGYDRSGLFRSLSNAVFFRGAAYWLGQNDKERSGLSTRLGSFDFDKENITFLDLPFSLDETGSLRFSHLFFLGELLALFSISEVTSSIWVLDQDNKKGPWTLWFSGQSSRDGYEFFKVNEFSLRKIFYCERDGGYFVCGKETYNVASGQVQEWKKSMRTYFELEAYSESLVLSKANGSHDLRIFP